MMLVLVLCLGCPGQWNSDQRQLEARLKRFEEEEGWRVLVDKLGILYLDIRTASTTPLYLPPADTPDASYVGFASFSPDGTRITFGENWGHERALIVFDLIERKNEALLTMLYLQGARWSPSGKEIAFQGRLQHIGNYSLYTYRLSDKKLSLLVEKDLRPGEPLFSWAPDGKSIVYEDSQGSIWITDLDTRKRRKLGNGWFPTWSPNGRYIAYASVAEKDNQDPGYIVYDLQTGKKESILAGKFAYRSLIWSPDSRYLVGSRASRGFWDLFGFRAEEPYGDLYVTDLESKVEVRVYSHSGGSIFPADWARSKPLR